MNARATFAFQQRRTAAVAQRETWLRTAIHEAGHCVVGHHLGLDVALLRVELPSSGQHADGRCRFTRPPYEAMSLADELVMSAAGGLADAKRSGFDSGGGTDLADVIDPVMRHCGGDDQAATAMLLDARERARELIDRFWPEIRALAEALADAGEMTATQIAPFVASIPRATPPSVERSPSAPMRSRPAEVATRPAPGGDPMTRSAEFWSSGRDREAVATAWCPLRRQKVPTYRAVM
jgi:hypothetical protein